MVPCLQRDTHGNPIYHSSRHKTSPQCWERTAFQPGSRRPHVLCPGGGLVQTRKRTTLQVEGRAHSPRAVGCFLVALSKTRERTRDSAKGAGFPGPQEHADLNVQWKEKPEQWWEGSSETSAAPLAWRCRWT